MDKGITTEIQITSQANGRNIFRNQATIQEDESHEVKYKRLREYTEELEKQRSLRRRKRKRWN